MRERERKEKERGVVPLNLVIQGENIVIFDYLKAKIWLLFKKLLRLFIPL